jgi:hypothetical protein
MRCRICEEDLPPGKEHKEPLDCVKHLQDQKAIKVRVEKVLEEGPPDWDPLNPDPPLPAPLGDLAKAIEEGARRNPGTMMLGLVGIIAGSVLIAKFLQPPPRRGKQGNR